MAKALILLTILAMVCLVPSIAIEFDINNAKYKRGQQYWNVDIPIINPAGIYTINYENLPTGWSTQGNSLSIPASVTKYEGNYPLKVSVKSISGIVLRRTLLFKFSGSGLFLGDYPYEYNFQSTSSSSTAVQSSGSYVKSSEAISTQIVSTKILGSQYSALPSYTDLDKIIDTADVVLITKTIQSVIQSNLNCLAKMGYLSDFLGKIESYISIKGFRAKDLKQIIDVAKAEIAKLQAKITDYNNQITKLGIPALKIQLNKALAKLQLAYTDFNIANIDTSPFELKITNFKNEITAVNAEVTKATTLLNSDKTQITTLNAFILELEDKLAKAKIERDNFVKRVAQTQDFITKSLARIQEVQTSIAQLDLKIKDILANKDKLKINSENLQRQVDKIKNTISISEKRQAQVIGKITDLKIQISAQELKLDRNQLDNINEMIGLLEGQILTVRQKIDQLDLQCNGVININVQVLDKTQIIYTFNPTQFQSYFNGFYGTNAFSSYSSFYKDVATKNQIFYGYNIFSDQWASAYGAPYISDIQLAYNTGLITQYSFNSDFQCSNYKNLINMYGKINNITGNIITVVDQSGKVYQLQLGACSRINGINQYIPTLGNQIAWRGVSDSSNRYLIHTATCY